jgi:Tol biopolymer transport system component
MGPNGENSRKLLSTDGQPVFLSLQWSPDGSRIAYIGSHLDGQSPYAPYIGTLALHGGRTSVILPDFLGSEFCWTRDGRIIYTRAEPAPNNLFTNLWELEIDSRTGTAKGHPHPLTSLSGFDMSNLSVSSDGQKVAVKKNSYRSDIYVGHLKANGQLGAVRRLTFDERLNRPTAWTLDSKSIIFASDRTGVTAIYRQESRPGRTDLNRPGGGLATACHSRWLLDPVPGDTQYSASLPLAYYPFDAGAGCGRRQGIDDGVSIFK